MQAPLAYHCESQKSPPALVSDIDNPQKQGNSWGEGIPYLCVGGNKHPIKRRVVHLGFTQTNRSPNGTPWPWPWTPSHSQSSAPAAPPTRLAGAAGGTPWASSRGAPPWRRSPPQVTRASLEVLRSKHKDGWCERCRERGNQPGEMSKFLKPQILLRDCLRQPVLKALELTLTRGNELGNLKPAMSTTKNPAEQPSPKLTFD